MMRCQPLKVAALIDSSAVSGPSRQLAALSDGLRARGVELHIFMFQRGQQSASLARFLEVRGIPHVVMPDPGPFDPRLLWSVRSRLSEWKPDIVQTHNYRTTVFGYVLSRLGAPWRWVAFFHGETNENLKVRAYNRVDRMLLPRADHLVVMSERQRDRFARSGCPVQVIYNAVIPLRSTAPPVKVSALRLAGVPLVGFIGRLSREKGVDILLEAIAHRFAAGCPTSLIVAGNGPERERLQRQAASFGIGAHVHFLGHTENVGSLYPQLDLVVLPSRSEGLPNVLLEALQADVPVVATAVGAVPEVLVNPAAGEIAPPGNATELSHAIGRALVSGGTAPARIARASTVQRFTLSKRIADHLALYGRLLPGHLPADGTSQDQRLDFDAAGRTTEN